LSLLQIKTRKQAFTFLCHGQYLNDNKGLNAEVPLEVSCLEKTLKNSSHELLQLRILLEKMGDFSPHFSYFEKMNV
jgi:hypothetical protein